MWVERTNVGAAYTRSGRLIRFGRAGRPDITGIYLRPDGVGQALYIEVKRPGERIQPDSEQAVVREVVLRFGGLHFEWWCVEQARAWLDTLPN